MARFQPGHPKLGGKRKGSRNKKTIDKDLLARALTWMDGPDYFENVQRRIERGRAPHAESYLLQRLKGKAPEQIELTGADRKPLKITVQVVRD